MRKDVLHKERILAQRLPNVMIEREKQLISNIFHRYWDGSNDLYKTLEFLDIVVGYPTLIEDFNLCALLNKKEIN